MNIDGVRTGTVLDHIQAGKGWEIYNLLKLDDVDCTVAIIQRANSTKYGKKDIIKIDGDIDIDLDILGYFDTKITVNRIKDSVLVEKVKLKLPEKLVGVIECRNPRYITSVEQGIEHQFRLADREKKRYRCIYCDTLYNEKK
ncbi:MAG: aspartate carbamoyltransferase regulatory subunit [Mogibacterium sp.]|nr:aspartate carbamoyltransferase regulatory subunit [Mogibacterium sp.]